MTTMKLAMAVILVTTIATGCEGERPIAGEGLIGAAGAGGAAMGMGAGGAGGAASAGGAAEISKTFVREDRFLCLDWPVCPDGIISPAQQSSRVVFTWCSMQNAKVNCGPCMDTRTPACSSFIGRCKAPNWPVDRAPAFCADQVPAPRNVVDAFTICTGDADVIGPDGVAGSDARTVCGDPAP